jgi:hypothetical protein
MAPSNPDEFDGYRKWLGIANKKRPPTHYELLAISLDEDDPEVIRAAAEQRRHYVEKKRGEGHDAVVTEILYRIGEAETTLLNDEMRRDYDRQLNLFEKRRKNRQVDPFASPSRIRSQPGRTVGEDSGIVKTFAGIMAVVCVGFGGMAWFSFGLPWSKTVPQAEPPLAQAAQVPVAAPPVQLAQIPEPAVAQPERVKEAEPIKPAAEQIPVAQQAPPAQLAPESAAHWKFWDVFGKGAKKDSLIVSRDGMLLSPAHEQAFCLTSAKEFSGLDLKLEFQFQTADGLANPYVGVVSTLPNPAASDWKQQIPRSVQIKLDPKVAGELVLPTADFKVKLNEVQKIHNARHIAPINKAEVKLREWNTLEVKCSEDSKLIVKINGVTVNRLEGMQTNKGHVVIWPANAEMRLRNAAVVVDGNKTKLSFETLE